MTTLDDILLPAVKQLLTDLGKDASWDQTTGGVYDPATGDVTGESVTNNAVKITPLESYDRKFVDGHTVKDGDAYCGVAAQDLAFTPKVGDDLVFDGETWEIVSVGRVFSGESVCLWYPVQVRR